MFLVSGQRVDIDQEHLLELMTATGCMFTAESPDTSVSSEPPSAHQITRTDKTSTTRMSSMAAYIAWARGS